MQATNIAEIVEQIHEKVAHQRRSSAHPQSSSRKWPQKLSDLRTAYEQVYRLRNSIGRLPPRPDTARARIGQWAVRIVQRMLFWYTPQISRFNSAVMLTLDQTCALLAECLQVESVQNEEVGRELALLLARLSSLEGRLNALQYSGKRVSSETSYAESKPLTDGGSDLDDFHFCLQDHFRGPEGDTSSKLRYYLSYIHQVGSTQLDGRWLDIGCGRGEWIQLTAEKGIDVSGLDSNRIAVAYCQAKGLEVEEADALTFLRQVPEKSLSGVTAFHTVEHWPYSYALQLFTEIHRALKPGGLLIVETPNPANVMMACRDFWLDPTHVKPLPIALLQLMLESRNFTILHVAEFDRGREEKLPCYEDSQFLQKLNEHFYAPQDYAMIGRR